MRMMCCRKALKWAVLLLMVAVMAACSGGGSTPTTATIKGLVKFPEGGDVVAKRAGAVVTDTTVTVEVYSLDGKKIESVTETKYDNVQNNYSYTVPGLHTNTDYVVKVKRLGQVLKKLIDKKSLVDAATQNVDATTTATVMIAEQKLSTAQNKVVLGEELPAGAAVSPAAVAALSQEIQVMNPQAIELQITTTLAGGKDALTSETATYANLYNMVVVAVSDDTVGSVEALLAAGGTATVTIPTFTVTDGTVTQNQTEVSSETATSVVETATDAYVPPVVDTDMAPTYVAAAKVYLNKQDIANAYKNFELALMANADNVEANAGAAITGGLMILDDEQVRTIVEKWDYVYPTVNEIVQTLSPVGNPFNNMTAASAAVTGVAKTAANTPVAPAPARKMMAAFNALKGKMPQQKKGFKSLAKELGLVPTTAPTVSEMQAVIDNAIIPTFDKVIARLAKVEGKASNTFTITAQMQGNPQYGQDVVLADAEYYTLDAAVNVFQTIFKFTTAYNFDIPAGYTYDSISLDPLAMVNDPKVFTLKTDGRAKMNAAIAYARVAAAKTKAAYDAVKTRTSGEGAFNLASWSAADKASFEKGLVEVTAAMNGQTTIRTNGATVAVDFTKFFTNPLTRANLPTFGYDVPRNAELSIKYDSPTSAEITFTDPWNNEGVSPVKCDLQPKSDIPDFTLNGIFPGNTASSSLELAQFSGFAPYISGQVLSGEPNEDVWNYTSDGQNLYYLTPTDNYGGVTLKKIVLATGAVSSVATYSGNSYIGKVLFYNSKLQVLDTTMGGVTLSALNISGSSFTLGTPTVISADLGSYNWLAGATANGSDIYYAVQSWNNVTYTTDMQVRKLANGQTDTLLYSDADEYFENVSVYNGYIYADGRKRSLSAPSVILARYPNVEDATMIGGYFYDIYDGKLVKYAGAPNGGSAKAVARF